METRVERDWRFIKEDQEEDKQSEQGDREEPSGGGGSSPDEPSEPDNTSNGGGGDDGGEESFEDRFDRFFDKEDNKAKEKETPKKSNHKRKPESSKPTPQMGAGADKGQGDFDRIAKEAGNDNADYLQEFADAYSNDEPLTGRAKAMVEGVSIDTDKRDNLHALLYMGLHDSDDTTVLREILDSLYQKNPNIVAPSFDPLKTNNDKISSSLVTKFSALISRLSEDMSGEDIRGDEFWDIERLLYRSISKVPLPSCKKSRKKERMVLIVDSSPSCKMMAVLYSRLAKIAIKQGDVDVVIAPNMNPVVIANQKGVYPLGGQYDMSVYNTLGEMFKNRHIIVLADTDGDDWIKSLSIENKVIWMYFDSLIHRAEQRGMGVFEGKDKGGFRYHLGKRAKECSRLIEGIPFSGSNLDRLTDTFEASIINGKDIDTRRVMNVDIALMELITQGVIVNPPRWDTGRSKDARQQRYKMAKALLTRYPVILQKMQVEKILKHSSDYKKDKDTITDLVCKEIGIGFGDLVFRAGRGGRMRTSPVAREVVFGVRDLGLKDDERIYYAKPSKIKNNCVVSLRRMRKHNVSMSDVRSGRDIFNNGNLKIVACFSEDDISDILDNKTINFS
jgi:hypothetical protein